MAVTSTDIVETKEDRIRRLSAEKQRRYRERKKSTDPEGYSDMVRKHSLSNYHKNKADPVYMERRREQNRLDYQRNKEARKAKNREYAQLNREKMAQTSRDWAKANPDKIRAKAREFESRKRAIKRNCMVELTELEKEAIAGTYMQCERLNEILGRRTFEVDHTVPLSKGGKHHPNNLQVVPTKWNREKNNRHSERWEVPYGCDVN
jgi:hypothetical protein